MFLVDLPVSINFTEECVLLCKPRRLGFKYDYLINCFAEHCLKYFLKKFVRKKLLRDMQVEHNC